jgi:hypothetical protein
MDITKQNFEEILGGKLSSDALDFFHAHDFKYELATKEETDSAVVRIVDFLLSQKEESGPEYRRLWETGWSENLELYLKSGVLTDLIPKFVRRNELVRFNGQFIRPNDSNFETNFVTILRDTMFRKYLKSSSEIWEFGCGTGLNLVHLSRIFPDKKCFGCDWAKPSVDILNQINSNLGLRIEGFQFDIFQPDAKIIAAAADESALFTIGTMEQIGRDYLPFLNEILNSKFKTVIHIETNYELYDEKNLLDNLAMKYIEKRNWLQGYFAKLRELEIARKISILDERKTFGSFFHDGYSVVVWENLNV